MSQMTFMQYVAEDAIGFLELGRADPVDASMRLIAFSLEAFLFCAFIFLVLLFIKKDKNGT